MSINPHATINLNTAEENVLIQKLKISPRLAKRILALRPFQSVEELRGVWGLDAATWQRILPLVSVEGASAAASQSPATQAPSARGAGAIPMGAFVDSPAVAIVESTPAEIKPKTSWKVVFTLIALLLVGAYFRLVGLNWDDNHHQHPDERFVTMVADGIRGVGSLGDYFDTANSTLNPLKFGSYTYGMLPLFLTRLVAEWAKLTDFDQLTLVGRALSGLFDLAAVWLLFLLGKRLYDARTGLLAAALGVAAVLPIQLSHYFTVDSFSTVFVVACFYFTTLAIPFDEVDRKMPRRSLAYAALVGCMVGLAGACKVNTLPIFGVLVLAGVVRILLNWRKPYFGHALRMILGGWFFAAVLACLAFRILQPYAFAGPGFLGVTLNPRWMEVIREVTNQVAGNSDWPPNDHWTNRPLLYAWSNMVVWGMGIPLGLAAWIGWAWAGWRIWKGDWKRHLLPFFWIGAYFLWQNGQFWRYMRYFIPIYPLLILFAAWALVEIWDRTKESRNALLASGVKSMVRLDSLRTTWKGALAILAVSVVVAGSYVYALAFTRIYTTPITRIQASEWILQHFPAPLNLQANNASGGAQSYPISVFNHQVIDPGDTPTVGFRVKANGTASQITSLDISQVGVSIYFRLSRDEKGEDIITEARQAVMDDDAAAQHMLPFGDITLEQGKTYYLHYKIYNTSRFSFSNVSLRNENPDEPILSLDWNYQNQLPGTQKGSFPIQTERDMRLNRLILNSFQQAFVPTKSSLLISIFKETDDQNPLASGSMNFDFTQPGMHASPALDFPAIMLTGGGKYIARYQITGGGSLHLAGQAFALETSWDDALPLGINGYDPLGGMYEPLNLELYEPDTAVKRDAMLQVLAQSEYIVIPSNRAYDSMPRLPLRYPMTLKYYQTLFDCSCSGDDMENRAYGLKPPFHSPLGFDLVAVFENPPTLGFLTFPDQSADESFTVYDHPKVLIFKKADDFSTEKVRAMLYSVDLSQAIFQTPMAYTNVPTAMQLPADRLDAQTAGGTWSAMFQRAALFNAEPALGGVAWYILLFALGVLVFPLAYHALPGLPDRGYPLARIAALLLVAWLAWILGSYKLLAFTQLTILLCVGLVAMASGVVAFRNRKELREYINAHRADLLITEGIFLAIFLLSLSIRLGNPDLWHPWLGGEKPMDFSFFNAVLKSVYFPPEHPWFSDHFINYYYYGYVIAAIPTKLLGILPSSAYNLILPSWFAMTGIGVFSIARNLVAGFAKPAAETETAIAAKPRWRQRLASTQALSYYAGIFALVAVMLVGNLYEAREFWYYLPEAAAPGWDTASPVERAGAMLEGAGQVLSGQADLPGSKDRWYFAASRPILHDGPDTPIAEFPYFTFLYADMHPHLLTMPIYALALGWILSLLLCPLLSRRWIDRILSLLAAGLIFGVFRASHTWDVPTFFGLGVLAIGWDVWRAHTGDFRITLQRAAGYGLAFLGAALLFYWPFAEWFRTEYMSVEAWTGARTPLTDYLFVFGLSLFILLTMLAEDVAAETRALYLRWISTSLREHLPIYAAMVGALMIPIMLWVFDYQVVAIGLPILVAIGYFIAFKPGVSPLRRITWILFGIGVALTVIVEVVVLKGDVGRSNMVFRYYLEAWFFFGLAAATGLVSVLARLVHWPVWQRAAWLAGLALLVLAALSYPLIATGKKMADRWPDIPNPPHDLDGSLFMLGDAVQPDTPAIYHDDNRPLDLSRDYPAIVFMQEHVLGSPVIVEGHTTEYRWGSRFSIYTGLPSVVGWSWHVRQHNSLLDGALIDKRIDDVNGFYNTPEISLAQQFLKRYRVRYIVLGDLERAYYDAQGIGKFQWMVDQSLLRIVFGDNTVNATTIFEVP
jgi:YYY domain-containing protein